MTNRSSYMMKPMEAFLVRQAAPALLLAVFIASFLLFFNQMYLPAKGMYRSDMRQHAGIAEKIVAGSKRIPHPGLHSACILLSKLTGMPLKDSFILLLSLAVCIYAWILLLIAKQYLGNLYGSGTRALIVFSLLLLAAIYVPFVNPRMYLMIGTPNVWHNPTTIALRPLAMVILWLLASSTDPRHRPGVGRAAVVAGLLTVSIVIKPNFALSFIPAVIAWLVITYGISLRTIGQAALITLPAFSYLGFLYLSTFGDHAHNQIGLSFLTVWHHSTPHPLFALIQAAAFPLALLALRFRQVYLLHLQPCQPKDLLPKWSIRGGLPAIFAVLHRSWMERSREL
jgi:hypothetical protein